MTKNKVLEKENWEKLERGKEGEGNEVVVIFFAKLKNKEETRFKKKEKRNVFSSFFS